MEVWTKKAGRKILCFGLLRTKIYCKFQVWHLFLEEGNQPNSRYFKLVELEPMDRYFQVERFTLWFWYNHITATSTYAAKVTKSEGESAQKVLSGMDSELTSEVFSFTDIKILSLEKILKRHRWDPWGKLFEVARKRHGILSSCLES